MREPTQINVRVQITSATAKSSTRFITELVDEIKQHVDATIEVVSNSSDISSIEKNSGDIDLNTLLITLATSGGVLTTLIHLIKDRLTKDKTITIEIDGKKLILSGTSVKPEYTNKLVEEFIRLAMTSSQKDKVAGKKPRKSNGKS